MAVILKYTKSQYEAKLTELEGYLTQLNTHHQNLKEYQSQITDFWDDVNSSKTVETLFQMTRQVENAMNRTTDLINFYKKAIVDLGGSSSSVNDALTSALDIISGLGI